MLPLDDHRWLNLNHRGWVDRARDAHDTDAPFVREALAHLQLHPDDLDAFSDLWPYLCSEGTSWPAAIAAAPYLVAIAGQLPDAL